MTPYLSEERGLAIVPKFGCATALEHKLGGEDRS